MNSILTSTSKKLKQIVADETSELSATENSLFGPAKNYPGLLIELNQRVSEFSNHQIEQYHIRIQQQEHRNLYVDGPQTIKVHDESRNNQTNYLISAPLTVSQKSASNQLCWQNASIIVNERAENPNLQYFKHAPDKLPEDIKELASDIYIRVLSE